MLVISAIIFSTKLCPDKVSLSQQRTAVKKYTKKVFIKTLEMLEVSQTAHVQLAFPKLPGFALFTPTGLCVAVPSCGSPWTSVIYEEITHIQAKLR